MSVLQMELETLKTKVIEAFDNITYPKGFITEHKCEECFEVRKAFLNRDWKQITPKILQENYDKLPLFSPEAFHCFLPAYLIYSLENFAADDVCAFVVYGLMIRKDAEQESTEFQKRRFENFTRMELGIVSEFIDLAIQCGEYDIFIKNLERGKKMLEDNFEAKLKF